MNLTPALIETLDKIAPSPSELATKVFNILKAEHPELTDYELLAFAVEYIGLMCLTEHGYLREHALRINKDFYYAHYLRLNENICQQISVSELMQEKSTTHGLTVPLSEDSPPK